MKSLLFAAMLLLCHVVVAQENIKPEIVRDSVTPKENSLKEVQVYGNKKQYVKIDSDKTTVNVKDNVMLNSGSSLEAVKKLPGVITSPTGVLH
jgi:iron complex outermembrane receptor protein